MIEGDDLEISFNAKYLIDVLSRSTSRRWCWDDAATRFGTIRPLGIGEDVFFCVVMPMHPSR